MIKIINLVADAIMTLKPNLQYVLNCFPTNEAEFNASFQRVTGEDSNGTAIKLYFNGQQIHSETLSTAPGNNGNSFFAIGDVYNYNRTLTNSVVVSSCAIYDQELSANQIKYLARKTLGYDRVN